MIFTNQYIIRVGNLYVSKMYGALGLVEKREAGIFYDDFADHYYNSHKKMYPNENVELIQIGGETSFK